MCSINKKKKSSYTQAFILTRKMWDWHTQYMEEKPAYGPRDLSHLILSVMEQFVKADMQDELKGVDIAVIEDNSFKGWIQKNKIRYAFHGVSDSYIDYAKEHNILYNYSYNRVFPINIALCQKTVPLHSQCRNPKHHEKHI